MTTKPSFDRGVSTSNSVNRMELSKLIESIEYVGDQVNILHEIGDYMRHALERIATALESGHACHRKELDLAGDAKVTAPSIEQLKQSSDEGVQTTIGPRTIEKNNSQRSNKKASLFSKA